MIRRALLAVIATAAIAALPASALAASFLKLTNITGESTSALHAGEIDLLTFTQSFVRTGATKAKCGPITLMKNIDKSSPKLLKAVMEAMFIQNGVLTFEAEGADPFDYYTITMQDVQVTELTQTDAADPARIVEKLVLSARTFVFDYRLQSNSGDGNDVTFSWNCAKNSE